MLLVMLSKMDCIQIPEMQIKACNCQILIHNPQLLQSLDAFGSREVTSNLELIYPIEVIFSIKYMIGHMTTAFVNVFEYVFGASDGTLHDATLRWHWNMIESVQSSGTNHELFIMPETGAVANIREVHRAASPLESGIRLWRVKELLTFIVSSQIHKQTGKLVHAYYVVHAFLRKGHAHLRGCAYYASKNFSKNFVFTLRILAELVGWTISS